MKRLFALVLLACLCPALAQSQEPVTYTFSFSVTVKRAESPAKGMTMAEVEASLIQKYGKKFVDEVLGEVRYLPDRQSLEHSKPHLARVFTGSNVTTILWKCGKDAKVEQGTLYVWDDTDQDWFKVWPHYKVVQKDNGRFEVCTEEAFERRWANGKSPNGKDWKMPDSLENLHDMNDGVRQYPVQRGLEPSE